VRKRFLFGIGISILLVISLSIFPMLVSSQPSGNIYHVAPNGSDSNPGTESQPWQTIAYAVSQLQPGDTLIIHGGTYSEIVEITVSGTFEKPITIMGAPEEDVILDFNGASSNCFMFKQGASYINVENLKLRNCGIWTISLDGENRYITLSNLDVTGGESGIHLTAGESGGEPRFGPVEHIIIKNSAIHDSIYTAVDCTPGPCNYIVIRNSLIYNSGAETGFGADGIAVEIGNHIIIEDTRVYGNGGDGIDIGSRNPLVTEESSDVKVSRCLVYNNGLEGVKLWTGGVIENSVMYSNGLDGLDFIYNGDYLVVNTVVAGNSPSMESRTYGAIFGYPEPQPLGKQDNLNIGIYNSIFAFNGPAQEPTGVYVGAGVKLESDYNIWFSREDSEIYMESMKYDYTRQDILSGKWTSDTSNGEHSLAEDPLFVDLENGDLHLREGSPAIDAGTDEYCPGIDLDGGQRPAGAGCDISAYEFGARPATTTTTMSWSPSSTTTTTKTTETTPTTTIQETTITMPPTQEKTVTQTITQPPSLTTVIEQLTKITTQKVTQISTITQTIRQAASETDRMVWLILGLAIGLIIGVGFSILRRRPSPPPPPPPPK